MVEKVVSRRLQDLKLPPGAVEWPRGCGERTRTNREPLGPQGTRSEAHRVILWFSKLIQKHLSGISVFNVTHRDVRPNVVLETPKSDLTM
jgi:hypothetical protein